MQPGPGPSDPADDGGTVGQGRRTVKWTFSGDEYLDDLAFDLVDSGSSAGRAGFVLRLNGETDKPPTSEQAQQGTPS